MPAKNYDDSNATRLFSSGRPARGSWTAVLTVCAAILLTACSDNDDDDNTTSGAGTSQVTGTPPNSGTAGGNSSGSGSASNGSTTGGSGSTTALQSPFAGQYDGTVDATASAPGVGSASDTFPFDANIDGTGALTFSSEGFSFSTTVGENGGFSEVVEFDLTDDGTRCNGALNVVGNVVGTRLSGNVSGPVTCSQPGLEVTGTVSGNFDAARG